MKKITIGLACVGLAMTLSAFGLELWWRCHSDTFNIFNWQAGILLWLGGPGMGMFFIGIILSWLLKDK